MRIKVGIQIKFGSSNYKSIVIGKDSSDNTCMCLYNNG